MECKPEQRFFQFLEFLNIQNKNIIELIFIVFQKSYLNLIFFIEIHYWILLQNFLLINMFANSTDIIR